MVSWVGFCFLNSPSGSPDIGQISKQMIPPCIQPVYATDFGKWNYREWPAERIEEFWKYFDQMVRFHERDAKLSGGQGVVSIVDFDGFELNHHASPSCKIRARPITVGNLI